MIQIKGFGNVVFPARDLEPSIATWSALLAQAPAFQGDDFAIFTGQGVELGPTAKPWVDYPLVSGPLTTSRPPIGAFRRPEPRPWSRSPTARSPELGTGDVANGDPATGIVDVPGARLAVVRAADGNLLGLNQAVAVDWGSG